MIIEIETIGSIRMECNNGLNPEPSGSYMAYGDIKNYSAEIHKPFWVKPSERIEVEGISYVPTSIIEPQLTVQEWREMQSKVTTCIFGLKAISIEDYLNTEVERINADNVYDASFDREDWEILEWERDKGMREWEDEEIEEEEVWLDQDYL